MNIVPFLEVLFCKQWIEQEISVMENFKNFRNFLPENVSVRKSASYSLIYPQLFQKQWILFPLRLEKERKFSENARKKEKSFKKV
ncbi:MAG: hypothetical protein IJF17_01585 [Thermoguttaceae bacterium]|nr:hypothetical protein [Thermoguttaceae bacterium]